MAPPVKPQLSEEEFKSRYSPERLGALVRGEITGKEFHQLTQPQMLKMAVFGFTQYENGRYPEAQAIFQGLVFLDPNEAYYRIALGATFLAQEELELAEMSFTAAIDLKTTEVAAYVNRGEVYLKRGKIIEAAKDFKRAVELDPTGKEPLTQRARILASVTLQAMKKAKAEHAAKTAAAGGKQASRTPTAPVAAPRKEAPPKKK